MGLLEEMASKIMSKRTDTEVDAAPGIPGGIMELLINHPGGLSGLVQSFREKGAGEIVNSWISTGTNLPISNEQIQSVLGNEQVKQFASKIGISPDVASSKLAELLPTLVDRLTPDGKIPQTATLLEQGLAFFTRHE
jgi:uncharacterized protein YidB (DUF937 family)